MTKIVKEQIGFHYLLTKILLYTLILLKLNIFLKSFINKIGNKSITHNMFRIQDNECLMRFLRMTIKRITK